MLYVTVPNLQIKAQRVEEVKCMGLPHTANGFISKTIFLKIT